MKYRDYSVDDLMNEESFQSYVLKLKEEDVAFWKDYLNKEPSLNENAKAAADAICAFSIRPEPVSERIKTEDLKRLEYAMRDGKGMSSSSQLPIVKWAVGIAASLLLAVGVVYLQPLVNGTSDQQVEQMLLEKSNPVGRKSVVTLPDGTKVNLNAASSLRYSEKNGRREVFLTGEAFFKVKRDTLRPFTVYSGDVSTTALGTSFNVKAYEEDQFTKVYLVTGKVAIESKKRGKNNTHILLPGNGIVYDKQASELKEAEFDADHLLGWKEGSLKFASADFALVKKELERWYGVEIEVSGQLTEPWAINGSFKNQTLNNVLQSIQYTTAFDYQIEGETVKIKF